jgi:hypothetical protein
MLRLLDDEVRKVRSDDLDGNNERHMIPRNSKKSLTGNNPTRILGPWLVSQLVGKSKHRCHELR